MLYDVIERVGGWCDGGGWEERLKMLNLMLTIGYPMHQCADGGD